MNFEKTILNTLFAFCVIVSFAFISCSRDNDSILSVEDKNTSVKPRLLSFSFRASDNPSALIEDIKGEIFGDSIVVCRIPYIMPHKILKPYIEAVGGAEFKVDGYETIDFGKPVELSIESDNTKKKYMVYVYSFTGLPIMWIDTDNRNGITLRDEYIHGYMKLEENVSNQSLGIIEEYLFIKGRGNSTWTLPKKPYRLKFENKVPMLGENADKHWVLLANHYDKTLIRNHVAFYIGKLSCLDFTPKSHFVELMLNGIYDGTYQLVEKLRISKNRVNVGDDGFLLEIDAKMSPDDVYFKTNHLEKSVNIKDPDDIVEGDEKFNYVKNFFLEAENALYSENFKEPDLGWRKYFDEQSFVDWYLINEIAKNSDAKFYSSCYLNLKRGDKLKMGPIWDFDLAFGNDGRNFKDIEGLWVKDASWYSRLFEDEYFVNLVKARFIYFYNHKEDILQFVNENAEYLKYSAEENNRRWGVFYKAEWFSRDIWGNYYNEVQYLKDWLNKRMEWLKTKYAQM